MSKANHNFVASTWNNDIAVTNISTQPGTVNASIKTGRDTICAIRN